MKFKLADRLCVSSNKSSTQARLDYGPKDVCVKQNKMEMFHTNSLTTHCHKALWGPCCLSQHDGCCTCHQCCLE